MAVTTYRVQDLEVHVGDEEEIAELELSSATNFSRFSTKEFETVAKILGETEVLAKFNPGGNSPGDPPAEVLLEQVGPALWASRWRDVSGVTKGLGVKESEKIGKLDTPGQPYLHDLLAEQRSTARMVLPEETLEVVCNLADEKLQEIRYIVAGWTSISDAELPGKIKRGWDLNLAVLAAAEEILGINGYADADHRATRWDALKIFRKSVDRITTWKPTLTGKLSEKKVAAAAATLDTLLMTLTGDFGAETEYEELVIEPEIVLSQEEVAEALGEGFQERLEAVQHLFSGGLDNEAQLNQHRRNVKRTLVDLFSKEEFDREQVRTELVDYSLMRVLVKVDGHPVDLDTLGKQLAANITSAEDKHSALVGAFDVVHNSTVQRMASMLLSSGLSRVSKKGKASFLTTAGSEIMPEVLTALPNWVQKWVVRWVLVQLDRAIDKVAQSK
ncbi:hypothetical protein [Corynebacterium cystitidis]|uniref:hypothetical protein n=1 Tax=Corynebacterium cystitidis TaxID=35757 RepID=UPI00211E175D|nr:hypothetical protein [Corynebacterium cystitidis]